MGARSSSPSQSPSFRLWLNNEFFVDLDAEGYCLSDCIEGAMGYVVRCSSSQRGAADVAWKLPRMIADTPRENAYIAQLLEGERCNVRRIGNRAQQLIRSLGVDNPLEFFAIGVRPAGADPNTWAADQRVLVRFHKGKRPRFCAVQVVPGGELRVVPEGMLKLEREEWERLARFLSADALGSGRYAPAFLADLASAKNVGHSPYTNVEPWLLSQVADKEDARMGWYIGLPTIVYDWADGTLQDAISNRRRNSWTIVHHFRLVERVLAGIGMLHRLGMLHGDIRPANIMFTGDSSDPDNYITTDYGSLASGTTNIVGGDGHTDKTMLHAIVNARASNFYAPERRQAFEHEDGDTAIIAQDPKDRDAFIVAIGWRSRLDDPQSEGRPVGEAIEKLLRRCSEELERLRVANTNERHSRLCMGDRIRLREYVFEILEAPPLTIDGFSVMRCRIGVAKVCNERLVVPLSDFWEEFSHNGATCPDHTVMMALPKVVEIYQWSQATDLFSIGVLLLYSLHGQNQGESIRVEREFTELLDTLANPLYFSRMWPHVDRVVSAIERIIRDNAGISASEFRRVASGIDLGAMNRDLRDKSNGTAEEDTIFRVSLSIVQHITQTAPHASKLVTTGFSGNVAEFLLFLHFVFSCLHRKVDLQKYEGVSAPRSTSDSDLPFCADRTSREPKATERALQRARSLRELFIRGIFLEMKAEPGSLPDYRPVSAADLILQNSKLEQERQRLQEECKRVADEQTRNLAELQRERERIIQECKRLHGALAREEQERRRLEEEFEISVSNTNTLRSEHESRRTELEAQLAEFQARTRVILGWQVTSPWRIKVKRPARPALPVPTIVAQPRSVNPRR